MPIDILTRAAAGRELEYSEIDQNLLNLKAGIDFLLPADAAFSTAIPFVGNVYMPQQTVASVLAFTVAASPVRGARVYVRLTADGTNAPTFAGMKEWGGSAGYDNRAGIVNELEFYYDGVDYWYFINQAIGAVAGADTTAPTANSAAVANATPLVVSISMSESLDSGYVPASSAFAVGGHTVSSVAISGAAINLTCSAAFVNGESARTVSYTQPGTNNARDTSGNLLASFSGLSITNNVAALTAPGAPTGVIATPGNASASVAFTTPASNGGSAITGYTVTSSPGGLTGTGSASPVSVTGLTNGTSYTFTVTATNAIGTSSASSASSAVTPSAGATVPGQVTGLTLGTATGTTQPLTWADAASTGGQPKTDFTIQWSPAGANTWTSFTHAASTANAITVTGLTASTNYDYRVAQVNSVGTGAFSSTSTGSTTASEALRFGQLVNVTESGTSPNYVYTATSGAGVASYQGEGILNKVFGAGDAEFVLRITAKPNETIFGLTTSATPVSYSGLAYGSWISGSSTFSAITAGSPGAAAPSGTWAINDLIKIARAGTTITVSHQASGGGAWTTVHTWSGAPTTAFYIALCLNEGVVVDTLSGTGLA